MISFAVSFLFIFFFFFNDTATTEIYTLSLHDALPIFPLPNATAGREAVVAREAVTGGRAMSEAPSARLDSRVSKDRKSTRLNSSHANISYAVFCLKKKKIERYIATAISKATDCIIYRS